MIVVCGEALVDVIENPDGTRQEAAGGGPFNTARALARIGVPTAFLGHLSTDPSGRHLARLLREDGVSLGFATFGPEPTTTALAKVDSTGVAEYRFVADGTSAPNLTPDQVPAELDAGVVALHVGTLGLVLEPMASTLSALVAREHGRRMVVVDPNVRIGLIDQDEHRRRLFDVMSASALVKASEADLAWLHPGLAYEQAAAAIMEQGTDAVVVTLGADGAFGTHRDMRVRVEAAPAEVVDTIGAGDAFGAALLAWIHEHGLVAPRLKLSEAELSAAMRFACLAAAITCGRPGADPPHRWELESRAS